MTFVVWNKDAVSYCPYSTAFCRITLQFRDKVQKTIDKWDRVEHGTKGHTGGVNGSKMSLKEPFNVLYRTNTYQKRHICVSSVHLDWRATLSLHSPAPFLHSPLSA